MVQASGCILSQFVQADFFYAGILKKTIKLFLFPLENFLQGQGCSFRVKAKHGLPAGRCFLFVGTGQQAAVASKETVTEFLFKAGKIGGVLSQKADTSAGLKEAVGMEGAGGAGLQTAAAAAAAVQGEGSIRRQRKSGEQFSQQELTAEDRMNEHMIFSKKPQAGPDSQRAFS